MVVLIKEKGSTEPFRPANLSDFVGDRVLPGFDHSLNWDYHRDKPPRRIVTSSRSSSVERRLESQKTGPGLRKLVRNLSLEAGTQTTDPKG